MIKFINFNEIEPFTVIKKKYYEAIQANEKNINAMAISSYNSIKKEVDTRFVNLKIIDNDNLIFFTNYNSPKAIAFRTHKQVSAVLYWGSIVTQIRIRALISKTSSEFNNKYFKERSIEKNALAISSYQSKEIPSYDNVVAKFNEVKKKSNLKTCPDYWGGFSLKPYEIELWIGNKHRLNKRTLYIKENDLWKNSILEP